MKVLGDEIELSVLCRVGNIAVTPDAAPTVDVYTETGTQVISLSIPPRNKYGITGLFTYMLPLTSLFSTGRHVVRKTFISSGQEYLAPLEYFDIKAGGNASGQFIALGFLERPGGDFLVGQVDAGALVVNRGPKL